MQRIGGRRGNETCDIKISGTDKRKLAPVGISDEYQAERQNDAAQVQNLQPTAPFDILAADYWSSGDARKLFAPVKKMGSFLDEQCQTN